MEKVRIIFKKNTGDTTMDMASLNFRNGDKIISIFTNLVQTFVYLDDIDIVPQNVARNPHRMFVYKNRQLIEIDDLMYDVKYMMNNGIDFDPNYTLVHLRIMDAISKLRGPEKRESVISCIKGLKKE